MLYEGEPPELPAELEGGEDGVLAGEGDERGRGQRAVRVDARPGVPQAVLVPGDGALFTAASETEGDLTKSFHSMPDISANPRSALPMFNQFYTSGTIETVI